MRNFLSRLWWLVTAPLRLLWWIIGFPYRAYVQISVFLTEEPDEHELMDVVSGVIADKEVRQAMWDQVDDLRNHLLRSILGLALMVGLSFFFTQSLIEYLATPIGGIDALRAIDVTESIGVFMKVALLSGVAISLPYLAFEFWLFVAPGLKPRSRKFGLLAIPLATLLFISGMAFTFYVMMPTALPFLLNFMGMQSELRPQSYFNFVIGVMFWLGVAAEFPLVIFALTSIGLVKPKALAEQWRLAIVVIAILAAAVTPTVDPVNMALVMAPMSLLYFISIILSQIAYRGRLKQEKEKGIDGESI